MPEEKKKCSPCEINATLQVGDRVCHRLSDVGVDCHRLADEVRAGRMSAPKYVDKLIDKAKGHPEEERTLKEVKKLLEK